MRPTKLLSGPFRIFASLRRRGGQTLGEVSVLYATCYSGFEILPRSPGVM